MQSALGETLRAEIEVTSITPEEASSVKLRTMNCAFASDGLPEMEVGCRKPSRPSVVSGVRCWGSAMMKALSTREAFTILFLA